MPKEEPKLTTEMLVCMQSGVKDRCKFRQYHYSGHMVFCPCEGHKVEDARPESKEI